MLSVTEKENQMLAMVLYGLNEGHRNDMYDHAHDKIPTGSVLQNVDSEVYNSFHNSLKDEAQQADFDKAVAALGQLLKRSAKKLDPEKLNLAAEYTGTACGNRAQITAGKLVANQV
jgi:hypothetical protein